MLGSLNDLKTLLSEINPDQLEHSVLVDRFRLIKRVVSEADPQDFIEEMTLVNQVGGELTYIKKCIKSKKAPDYSFYTGMVNPGEQIKLFTAFSKDFEDAEYWANLRQAYTLQDHLAIPFELLRNLFSSNREKKEYLMDSHEQLALSKLPNVITIYRGGAISETENGYGLSWSLNRGVAQRFAEVKELQTGAEMQVHEITIPKSEVTAYFLDRNEEEVIYLSPEQE